MTRASATLDRKAARPQPTWEVAYLFPTQGNWSEEDYLALNSNQLVELADGRLEVLPMPTPAHQLLLLYLYGLLWAFTSSRDLGTVLVAPVRVLLWRGKYREPDVIFISKEHADRIGEKFCRGADLVMEVVSGDDEDRRRDLLAKRHDYARGRIPEYWIVDPKQERITVLRLSGKRYAVHGMFAKGTVASSHLLRGFTVDVGDALSHARLPTSGEKGAGKSRRRVP